MEDLKYVGEYSLELLKLVVASRTEPLNLKGNFQGLTLYEDIFEPVISGQLLITDPIALPTLGPITGQEELLIKLKTPTIGDPDKIVEFIDQPLIVTHVSNRQSIGKDIEGYLLNFTTRQVMKDRRLRVSKSLNGTYSTIVKEMFDVSGCSKRPTYIEETSGIKRIIASNEHPFDIIRMCAANALSTKTKSPTYMFFENIRGYHFRSLDSMYAQKSIHKLEPKIAGTLMDKGLHTIKEQLENILDYRIRMGKDTLLQTNDGIFGSKMIVWNMFDKSYSTNQYDMIKNKSEERGVNYYHKNGKDFSPYSETTDKDGMNISEKPAKTFLSSTSNTTGQFQPGKDSSFVLDSGSYPVSPTDDLDVKQRRKSQLNRVREGVDLEVKCYGNTLLSVGDIVSCNIPTKMTVEKTASEKLDPRYSGEYLITHIRHDFSVQEDYKHEMQIKLTRDSISEEIEVTPTQYDSGKRQDESYGEFY